MQRFRDSIASLIGVVGLVAVAAAGLRAATPDWDSGLLGVTLVVLLVGILLAIHRQGRKRAFWLGFAIFGWVTLGASLVPSIAERLPTTKGLTRLAALDRIIRPANINFIDYDLDGSLDLSVTTKPPNGPAPSNKGYASGVSFEKWMMWKMERSHGRAIYRDRPSLEASTLPSVVEIQL